MKHVTANQYNRKRFKTRATKVGDTTNNVVFAKQIRKNELEYNFKQKKKKPVKVEHYTVYGTRTNVLFPIGI